MTKSFLKWAGGKSQSIDLLQKKIYQVDFSVFPHPTSMTGTFIEPFVGSGVVFMNIEACDYIINDVNDDLTNLYRILKTDGLSFIEECEYLFQEQNNTQEQFSQLRHTFNSLNGKKGQERLRASLFLYLNRHCFNGLCRYNKSGEFNVPYGKYEKVYFPKKELQVAIDKLKRVTIFNESYEKVFLHAKVGDVIYCDPPYVPLSNTASFTDYAKTGFSMDQQKLLAKLAEEAPCLTLISNHDNDITRELYNNADEIITKEVSRFISASSDSRKPVTELLAIYHRRF